MNDRGHDFQVGFGLGADRNNLIECRIVLRTAVGVSRTVFGNRPDEDLLRAQDLAPRNRDRNKMRVAERNVTGGNARPIQVRGFDGDFCVRQSLTRRSISSGRDRDQPVFGLVEIGERH